jgi:hypothetical protein
MKRTMKRLVLLSALILAGATGTFAQDTGAADTPDGYVNFTGGERVATWAINSLVPGVGSFVIMKDNLGGGIQLGTGVLGIILIAAGITDIVKGVTYETTWEYDPVTHESGWVGGPDEDAISRGTTATVIGGILLAGNGIFNIVRSAMYNKPVSAVAGELDTTGLQLTLLPENKLLLSYTARF